MIELPLVFLGDCWARPIASACAADSRSGSASGRADLGSNVRRQLLYTAGRIFTYSFFGVVAGYAGYWIAGKARVWINVQAALCVIAGILLVGQGCWRSGSCRAILAEAGRTGSLCLAGTFVGPFLARPDGRTSSWPGSSPAFSLAAWSTATWRWRAARRTSGGAVDDEPLRSRDGPSDDPRRHGRFAALSCGPPERPANLGRLRHVDGIDLDRQGDSVYPTPRRPEVVRCVLCGSSGG